jgi:hypothetical protein
LRYEAGGDYCEWRQTSSPTSTAVSGYEAIRMPSSVSGFEGMQLLVNDGNTLINSRSSGGSWWEPMATKQSFSGGYPVFGQAVTTYAVYAILE